MAGRNNQQPEEQRWIKRLDFEASISTRPGALAAVRVAGGSERADAHLRSRCVNEDRGVCQSLTGISQNSSCQVGALGTEGIVCPKYGKQKQNPQWFHKSWQVKSQSATSRCGCKSASRWVWAAVAARRGRTPTLFPADDSRHRSGSRNTARQSLQRRCPPGQVQKNQHAAMPVGFRPLAGFPANDKDDRLPAATP